MNIEIKVSASQSSLSSSVLQRIRRVVCVLESENIEVKTTFGDESPQENKSNPIEESYPELDKAILRASKG